MTGDLDELYQEVLLEHSRRPRNFGEIGEPAVRVHGDNPACGDEIHLHVRFGEDGRVEDVKFTGQGCAISQASASLMTVKLKGKSRADALALADAFQNLVTSSPGEREPTDAERARPKGFGDLAVFGGVRKFPQRVKCAMLAWRAFEQALNEGSASATVSTE